LRIIFKHERGEYILDLTIPETNPEKEKIDEVKAYNKHLDDEHEINALMVAMIDGGLHN
jgi:hypothetical protein